MWNETLHAALVVAVADVLQEFGAHAPNAKEDQWWTVEQVTDFAELMERQVNDIAKRHP